MAIQSIEELVKNRLPSTIEKLGGKLYLSGMIEEVKVLHDYDEIDDNDLSPKEKMYIAALTAKKIIRISLDKYMQEAKAKGAESSLDVEYQDKLKYIKTSLAEVNDEIELLAYKLGKSTSGKGIPPPRVIKVGAAGRPPR